MNDLLRSRVVTNSSELIQHSLWGWFGYFVVFNIYSIFWRQYTLDITYNFTDSLIFWTKEWAMWMVFTPFIIIGLNYFSTRFNAIKSGFIIGSLSLPLIITFRILFDFQMYTENLSAVIVSLLPKYSFTYLLVSLIWYHKIFSRREQEAIPNLFQPSLKSERETDNGQSLTVEYNGLNIKVLFKDIYFISASGNYVEIACEQDTYLKRATLKQIMDTLSKHSFIQVHRSHIVNIDKIQKLKNTETGAATLTLKNDHILNVSKKYKADLKQATINST
jgi:hypothetical protein